MKVSKGYICNIEMSYAKICKRKSTISSLLKPFLNLWHITCIRMIIIIASTLHKNYCKKETGFCRTLIRRRSVPNCLRNLNWNLNAIKFYRKNNVMVQAWRRKKKTIYLVSTIHSANMIASKCHRTKKRTKKPTGVVECKEYMKDMDWTHRDLAYYSILCKTEKWTKKSVLCLINCAL